MRKYVIVVAGLLLGIVLGATVFRAPVVWAAQAISATIVGPLDANGNVKVHEQGTATVSVSNGATAPVPVFDVAGATRQPFQVSGTTTAVDGSTENSTCTQVPAGKRLVIQYIDGAGFLTTQLWAADISTTVGGTVARHQLLFQTSQTANYPLINSDVALYADPGTSWCVRVYRGFSGSTTGTIGLDWSVSGYYVDTP
jgi:hypothetical protein